MKRALDLSGSLIGLVILSPLFLIVTLAIRLSGPGPIRFRQERVGRHGRFFRICKFRTMVPEAHNHGGRVTVGGDARITPVGVILRRTKVDELPQLINVLKGEMSLVGPRPEVPEFVEMYREQYEPILAVRPGITHRVSLIFRNEESLLARARDPERFYRERVMPRKIAMYRQDLGRESVLADVGTIVGTILAVSRQDFRRSARRSAAVAFRRRAAVVRLPARRAAGGSGNLAREHALGTGKRAGIASADRALNAPGSPAMATGSASGGGSA